MEIPIRNIRHRGHACSFFKRCMIKGKHCDECRMNKMVKNVDEAVDWYVNHKTFYEWLGDAREEYKNLSDVNENDPPDSWISSAFKWIEAPSGYEFWRRKNSEWQKERMKREWVFR